MSREPRQPGGDIAPSDRLRGVIVARGLTASEVARRAGVAQSVLSRFVNAKRGLTLATFDRVALALGLKLVEGPRRG
jgi:transcriptional regulator with XRE-family HTH domain